VGHRNRAEQNRLTERAIISNPGSVNLTAKIESEKQVQQGRYIIKEPGQQANSVVIPSFVGKSGVLAVQINCGAITLIELVPIR
jgi:hypothetical protein